MLDISVIIPTLNRSHILKKTVESLFNQTYPKEKYEIIVVDDGSTDGTADTVGAIRVRALNLTYLRQSPSKKGPAAANNLGIKNARGEYILFLNDDVIADSHLIEEHMKTNKKHENIIVQGSVVNTSSLENLGEKHEGYSGGYTNLSFGYFTTWNCSIKKDLLYKAGLFDEDFTNLCWEDVEFGLRLRKLGVKQKYNKKAFGFHYKGEFKLADLDKVKIKSINMGKNALIYLRKHPKLEVRISTQVFWLPRIFYFLLNFIVKILGSDRIVNFFHYLEGRKKKRLLGFFVGLAGYYWYLRGMRQNDK